MRSALCTRLGLEIPVVQSGMNRVAGPELVAAVSEAGGLGILAGLNMPPEQLHASIARIRALTKKPFGVNLWMHPLVRKPPDPAAIDPALLARVQQRLDGFRARAGLAPRGPERPGPLPDLLEQDLDVVLSERVPLLSTGLGDPGAELVERCHQRGVQVMAMVSSVVEARLVEASGVDFVVAQGAEAGGHRSTWTDAEPIGTVALVPQIVDAVRTPVIASGGIADGRGLVAALALGACGVLLGTRFVATRESIAPDFWKRALLERPTRISSAVTGLPARLLENALIRESEGEPLLPPLLHRAAASDLYSAGNPEFFPMFAGQSAPLSRGLPGAGEVVKQIAAEARDALQRIV